MEMLKKREAAVTPNDFPETFLWRHRIMFVRLEAAYLSRRQNTWLGDSKRRDLGEIPKVD